jgi:hypothetical protein
MGNAPFLIVPNRRRRKGCPFNLKSVFLPLMNIIVWQTPVLKALPHITLRIEEILRVTP